MARTGTEIFEPGSFQGVFSVRANGGTVALQIEHDDGVWVTVQVFDADGGGTIDSAASARVRIVPSGGATWEVHV